MLEFNYRFCLSVVLFANETIRSKKTSEQRERDYMKTISSSSSSVGVGVFKQASMAGEVKLYLPISEMDNFISVNEFTEDSG